MDNSDISLNDIISRTAFHVGGSNVGISAMHEGFDDWIMMRARLHSLLEQAVIYWEKYQKLRNIDDLNKTICFARQVIDLVPDTEPDKQNHLNNLAVSLTTRFHHTGDLADLEDAISLGQRTIELTPEDASIEPDFLNTLGSSLLIRFERLGEMVDLDTAIALIQQAIDLASSDYPSTPSYLTNLGNAFEKRFEWLGDKTDLDESILMQLQAVDLSPDGHNDKPGYLHNLGTSYHTRFERFGEVADIDRAIQMQQQAVDAIPDEHIDKPEFLNNLGNTFLTRFERSGGIADINQAVLAQKQAVHLTPDGHSRKPGRLSNLGNSLLGRFERLGEMADIDQAILVQQQAVDFIPDDHVEKSSCLTNLGASLDIRFSRYGDMADLDRAITVEQQAVNLTSDDHIDKPSCLTNLGNSLLSRFQRLGEVADIDEAISAQRQAVGLTPDDHAGKPVLLKNLGNSLELQFRRTSDHDYLRDALSSFSTSARLIAGSPRISLESARRWALLASEFDLPSLDPPLSSMQACRVLMDLVPRVIWVGNSVTLRYEEISAVSDAISLAAPIACSSGFPDVALEWLEQGRSIIWGQMLRLRIPMDDLKRDHPELAASMEDLSRSLELSGAGLDMLSAPNTLVVVNQREAHAQKHRRIAEEWESLLARVRQCPGYEHFLQPPKLAALAPAAALGPIVVISIAKSRCDAIILQYSNGSSKLDHVYLKSASLDKIEKAHLLFTRTLTGRSVRYASGDPEIVSLPGEVSSSPDPEGELEGMLHDLDLSVDSERASAPSILVRGMPRVLQMLWIDIVEPVFQKLGYMLPAPGSVLPRVTWCATGPLALLPLHAAGSYAQDGSASDTRAYKYAVSSYTPSLSTLLKREQDKCSQGFRGLAAISQPSTPGQNPLPGTVHEVMKIQDLFETREFTWLNDAAASRDSVLHQMRECSWIHLACHGIQREQNPMESAFMLHDGPLDLRTMSREKLPYARLAFLSACQTAKGEEHIPEESAHLAAGMLMSGYHTVIGTMWSIRDQDGPIIAEEFYKYLKSHGVKTNNGEAAYALHEAVACLREKVGDSNFLSWIPFIHLGI